MDVPKIDLTRLTPEQRDKLDQYKQAQDQLQVLQDSAMMMQEIINQLDDIKKADGTDKVGALLMDMRESLSSLNAKEAPKMPDTSKPMVEAVTKLEKALSASIKAIDVKPVIEAPQVHVDSPSVSVDLKGVEKAMAELPKAFKTALSSIPKIPKPDYTPLLKSWEGISEQLVSIENTTRMKPQPGTMKITNPDGSSVTGLTNAQLRASLVGVSAGNTTDANPATQNITARDVSSVTTTSAANNQPSTIGTPTAGSVASYALTGYDSARVQISGIWTGTLVAQVSLDGIIWYNQGVHQSGTTFTTSTFTGNFSGTTNAAGVNYWRVQSTTTWTGTAIVRVVASINPSSVYIANNVGINANSPNPVSTTSAIVNVGQKTVSTTAVQVSAVSTVPTNGILIEALSTNAASIFIGGLGVTTSTGFEIQAGQVVPFTCNLNTLYIISVASITDKIAWNVT